MDWIDQIYSLVDHRSIIETSLVALSSSITAILCYLYKQKDKQAKKVEDALTLDVNSDLASIVRDAPNSTLPYVAINGKVSTLVDPLSCLCDRTIKGVFWKKTTKEHKDVWQKYSQSWDSTEREISSVSDSISFILSGKNSANSKSPFVKVMDPYASSWIQDSIEPVYETFTPSPSTVSGNIFGFISGDRLKGFTDTEYMLRLGTNLCAIGELVYKDDIIRIQIPSTGVKDYIISKQTQREIVSQIRGKATFLKVMALLLGTGTVTAVYFVGQRLWKRFKELQDNQRTREEFQEVRRQRTAMIGRLNRENAESNASSNCIICLDNPRECVLLDCGHICICVDCLERLPTPKECPMCRSRVIRTVPLFHV